MAVVPVAVVAAAVAIVAATLDSTTPIGPGSVLCTVLVVLWARARCSSRPAAPTSRSRMVMAAGALAAALLGSARLLGHGLDTASARDLAAAARALGVALLAGDRHAPRPRSARRATPQ